MIERGLLGFDSVLGKCFGWIKAGLTFCMLALVLLCFALVLARYSLDVSWIAGQEAVQWLHAICFMLGAAVTLRAGGHVRVDVLHARLSSRSKAWIEIVGCAVFLLPFATFLMWISFDYVAASAQMREASQESGGLPMVYLLKALIPLAAALLIVQALAELISAWRVLTRSPAQ